MIMNQRKRVIKIVLKFEILLILFRKNISKIFRGMSDKEFRTTKSGVLQTRTIGPKRWKNVC